MPDSAEGVDSDVLCGYAAEKQERIPAGETAPLDGVYAWPVGKENGYDLLKMQRDDSRRLHILPGMPCEV